MTKHDKDSELYKRLSNWPLYNLRQTFDDVIRLYPSDRCEIKFNELLGILLDEFPSDEKFVDVFDIVNTVRRTLPADFWTNPESIGNTRRTVLIMKHLIDKEGLRIDLTKISERDRFARSYQDLLLSL